LPTNVGHCADPGCYSRPVTYNASSKQMTALAELSYECHQSIQVCIKLLRLTAYNNHFSYWIQYDCNFAPFELNDVSFCWWNDKDGNAKYFWSGGNTDVHTCQCGIDQNCVEAFMKCNCDSNAPVELSDIGNKLRLHHFWILFNTFK
jgi:spore maturation protein CgeB